MIIFYNLHKTNIEEFIFSIAEIGYWAYVLDTNNKKSLNINKQTIEYSYLLRKVIFGSIINLILLVISSPKMVGFPIPLISNYLGSPRLQLILSVPVVLWYGEYFYRGVIKYLSQLTTKMSILLIIRTGTAFFVFYFYNFFP